MLPSDAYQTDRKPFPVGKRTLASRRLRNHLPNFTIQVMTGISTLPKSVIVSGAEPELAMVEVVDPGDRRVRNPATSAALA